ncbi:MAG: hypothetical protein ACR5K3_02650 [Wolbachia sp.]
MTLRSSKIDRKQVHYTTFLNEFAKKLDLASRAGMTPLLTGKTVPLICPITSLSYAESPMRFSNIMPQFIVLPYTGIG